MMEAVTLCLSRAQFEVGDSLLHERTEHQKTHRRTFRFMYSVQLMKSNKKR